MRKNKLKKFFEKRNFLEKLWDIDAWFDSSVYQFFAKLSDMWSAYASRIDRWHITGFRRLVVDVVGDCFTFALIFVFGIAYLAIPAVTDEENVWSLLNCDQPSKKNLGNLLFSAINSEIFNLLWSG